MRKAADQRDAQTISLLWTSLLLFHGGDVSCFDACHVIWCGGHVIWCDVIACVVSCHVMQCDVMWFALMWFDAMWLLVLGHVTWCKAMSCDVRSCDELSSVVPCNGMECYELKMPLVVRSRCVFEVVLWRCCDPKYYSVLQSTTLYYKVLLQYYSVLLQYYSVLQSTARHYSVLHSTTTYYSSTTLYYKVLLQYCSVLQSTTPVLLGTTKYYSSTTLYYKVLLQYYSVLQSNTHDRSLSHMNRYLNCAEQQESASNFAKCCTCHAKWMWWLIRVTYETSFTMRGATRVTLQLHQILKRYLQCAEQKESQSNFTKYCACHAKWISWLIRVSHETSFTMRGASGVTLQLHHILRLPRKMALMIDPCHIWNVFTMRGATLITVQNHQILRLPRNSEFKMSAENSVYCFRQYNDDSNIIRTWSDDNPTTKSSSRTRRFGDLTRPILQTHFVWKNTTFRAPAISQNFTKCCGCHEKWRSNFTKYCACQEKTLWWLILISHETFSTMRGASGVILQLHQILRLPRKMTLMIDPCHIWNVIYIARGSTGYRPTSPNTAPATKFWVQLCQRKIPWIASANITTIRT